MRERGFLVGLKSGFAYEFRSGMNRVLEKRVPGIARLFLKHWLSIALKISSK